MFLHCILLHLALLLHALGKSGELYDDHMMTFTYKDILHVVLVLRRLGLNEEELPIDDIKKERCPPSLFCRM